MNTITTNDATNAPDSDRRPARAVVYARSAATNGASIERQRHLCEQHANAMGAEIVAVYEDDGWSGKTGDRPALRALLERLDQGDVDAVIVEQPHRLARNRQLDVELSLRIEAAGARLTFANGSYETLSDESINGIMATIAEFYADNLGKAVTAGLQRKVHAGGTPGRPPLGYRNRIKRSNGRLVRTVEVDPKRAPLITWAFEQFATGGWSLGSLRDELTAQGLRTRPTRHHPSRPVSGPRLRCLLRNPYYRGKVLFSDKQYQGKHRPLIDNATFKQVQEQLARRSTSSTPASESG